LTLKIQAEAFRVVMQCSVVVGYQCFGGLCCVHLQGILLQPYTASQPRRPRLTTVLGI